MTPTTLKQWRNARGLSQSQLAALLPVSLRTLQNWEGGARNMPDYLQRALRDIERELATSAETN